MAAPSRRKPARPAARRPPPAPARKTAGAVRPQPKPKRRGAAPFNTTSAFSPRLREAHAALDGHLRRLFPDVENVMAYNMNGWRVPRPRKVEWTRGTIDPNFVSVFVAERKQGITLHVWNPYEPDGLQKRSKELSAAGFKVMVGCVQFNRKGGYPVAAVVPILESIRARMDAEAPRRGEAPI